MQNWTLLKLLDKIKAAHLEIKFIEDEIKEFVKSKYPLEDKWSAFVNYNIYFVHKHNKVQGFVDDFEHIVEFEGSLKNKSKILFTVNDYFAFCDALDYSIDKKHIITESLKSFKYKFTF